MKKIIFVIALFSSSYCFGQNQKPLPQDSLPIKIKEKLENNYSGFSISHIYEEIIPGNLPIYKLQARKEKTVNEKILVTIYDLTFESEGKVLSERKDKEVFYTGSPPPKLPASHSKGDGHNH